MDVYAVILTDEQDPECSTLYVFHSRELWEWLQDDTLPSVGGIDESSWVADPPGVAPPTDYNSGCWETCLTSGSYQNDKAHVIAEISECRDAVTELEPTNYTVDRMRKFAEEWAAQNGHALVGVYAGLWY